MQLCNGRVWYLSFWREMRTMLRRTWGMRGDAGSGALAEQPVPLGDSFIPCEEPEGVGVGGRGVALGGGVEQGWVGGTGFGSVLGFVGKRMGGRMGNRLGRRFSCLVSSLSSPTFSSGSLPASLPLPSPLPSSPTSPVGSGGSHFRKHLQSDN